MLIIRVQKKKTYLLDGQGGVKDESWLGSVMGMKYKGCLNARVPRVKVEYGAPSVCRV